MKWIDFRPTIRKKDEAIMMLFLSILFSLGIHSFSESTILEADKMYQAGEMAKTIWKKEKSFNEALELLTEIEQRDNPQFGNGNLYFALGNTYYQLEEYPLAIYYYYRANALRPRDHRVKVNLQMAQKKLFIPYEEARVYPILSLSERLQLLFFSVLLFVVFFSVYLWTSNRKFYFFSSVFFFVFVLCLLSVGYSRYFSPLEGVLVRSSMLYTGPGADYPFVQSQPISSGNKVEVIDIGAAWIKVALPNEKYGYVPQQTIRLI